MAGGGRGVIGIIGIIGKIAMKLIRSMSSADLPRDGCVLTIGNFDAVHIGHREILTTLVAQSKQRGLPSVVMTFDPHPREYFSRLAPTPNSSAPDFVQSGARLTTTATRFFALRECGVDIMLSLRFNYELSHTSAEQFIRCYLAEGLKVKYLLVGDDFRFGAKRAGDFQLLEKLAGQYGYQADKFDPIKRYDNRISSTWIRQLLAAGELERATQLLGRRYTHSGRVIHGDKRGREWGFPTVNLAIRHTPALSGVFAVMVSGLADDALAGVASIGTRPTVRAAGGAPKTVLEVYLFNYHGDAYGQRICVEFVKKIRAEEKFANYDDLKKRIAEDAHIAKAMLAEYALAGHDSSSNNTPAYKTSA